MTYTLECSGNYGFPSVTTAVGNARWTGTPLAPPLRHAGLLEDARDVVFCGSDFGEEEVREIKMQQNFARRRSIDDAMNPDNLLCYRMNGAPLPDLHGTPLRLIAPGWYGIANVEWLKRIEIRDRRYMGRFMARDYVTILKEEHKSLFGATETVWAETSVSRALAKSMPLVVLRKDNRYRVVGAAWGAPISRVDARIGDGRWRSTSIERSENAHFAWRFWNLDWTDAAPGMQAGTCRAVDWNGYIQPTLEDSVLAGKKTYWERHGQVVRMVLLCSDKQHHGSRLGGLPSEDRVSP